MKLTYNIKSDRILSMKNLLTIMFTIGSVGLAVAQSAAVGDTPITAPGEISYRSVPAATTDAGNGEIEGVVLDTETNQPVEFATVSLIDPATDRPIDGAVCDNKGQFKISKVEPGTYNVAISFIGYERQVIEGITVEDKKDKVNLGVIKLGSATEVLQEVSVVSQRDMVEEKVDRTIYNAELDATTRGGNATDVLRRVPMLSVDMDGNVSLRGNENIRVLINNKPSAIMAANIADALKQIPADEIKSVEVITSPSAKYDAEGTSGIINIITKKNNLQGATLNVNTGVGYRGSNLGLNGALKTKKLGLSLGGFGRSEYNTTGSFENRQTTTSNGVETFTTQDASTTSNRLFGRYTFGLDYDFNEKNYLTGSVQLGARNGRGTQDDLTSQSFQDGVLVRETLKDVTTKDLSNNIDVSLAYTHVFDKPQKELTIMGMWSINDRTNDFTNYNYDVDDETLLTRLKNLNDSYDEETTLQIDYTSPIGDKQLVEYGAKQIMRTAVSDYTYLSADGENGSYVQLEGTTLNNNLDYRQGITSGYLSYTATLPKNYSVKAGARYEYTTITAFTKTESDIDIPSYGVIVPSVNLSKKLENGNMVKLGYNRRIQRPSIRFLNPNIQASNPLNISIGNPELDPEYTNNFELGYSSYFKRSSVQTALFVRNTTGAISSVRDVRGDTIRTTYQNIGQEDAYGINLSANINFGKLMLNGGSDVYYAVLSNNNPDPIYNASNTGIVISGRFFGNYDLGNGYGLQMFSFFRLRRTELQGYRGGFGMYNLGVKKDFNNKRGSIGLGVQNFLNPKLKIKSETITPIIVQNSIDIRNNLSFSVNFSYRLGKISMDGPQRRRKSIQNDDLKDGGDGGNGDGGGAPAAPAAAPRRGRGN
jgi:outer membrane receptor protein involved in Fe transport